MENATSGLNRVATESGAEVIALLEAAGSQVKVGYFWSRLQEHAPERRFRLLTNVASGTVPAGSPLAALLRDSISERCQSFLLFPWQGGSRVVTGVVGFSESTPPIEHVPEALVENLWSANEIARLRGELKTVSERLASRKLVEQAKSTLQAAQSISEERAYEYLRSVSRKRRITLAALSAEILGGRGLRNTAIRQGEAASPHVPGR
jgi:hypothetical protein